MITYGGKPTQAYVMEVAITTIHNEECWEPLGYIESNGCWKVYYEGKNQWAHRVAFKIAYRHWPIENIDHLCRNRWCWNPVHLDDVPQSINILRAVPFGTIGRGQGDKLLCIRGHPFDTQNTRFRSDGARICRTCACEWVRDARKKAVHR